MPVPNSHFWNLGTGDWEPVIEGRVTSPGVIP
jgi:hypothetical protein